MKSDGKDRKERRRFTPHLKISLSILLLWLSWHMLESPKDVLNTLSAVNPFFFAIAVIVFIGGQLAAAQRLNFILKHLRRKISYSTILRAHFIGLWFNAVLPTGIGGDVVKFHVLQRLGGMLRAARAVLLNRIFGFLALIICVIISSTFYKMRLQPSPLIMVLYMISLALLMTTLACIYYATYRLYWLRRFKLGRFLLLLCLDLRRLFVPARLMGQIWTSGIVILSVILCFMLIAISMGQPVQVLAYFVMVPLIILSMHLPVSLGGWGIREISAVTLLPFAKIAPEAAFAMSVIYGFTVILAGLPGLIWWNFRAPSD